MEYLSADESPRPKSGRKRVIAGVGAAALVILGGAAAYGVVQFLDAGESAATAVPADALGYLSIDLDPSGGQKVAAYETMRKFPALKEQLNLDSDEDARQWIFDAINEEAPEECKLDFEDDVAPWLGNQIAFSGVETEEGPQPFFVLEVSDADAAEQTVEDIFTCDGEEEFGTATVGEFMIVAPSADLADDVAADAEESPLSDDETFQARLDDAGDQGVVTGYLAPAAIDSMLDQAQGTDLPDGTMSTDPLSADSELDVVRDYLEDFEGAAMQVRFADEGLEMEMVASGIEQIEDLDPGTTGMTELPETTGVAYGLAAGPDFVEQIGDAVRGQMSDEEYESQLQMFEQQTGLAFPEDIQTLLGDGLSVAVDGSIDVQALQQAFMTGQTEGVALPVGIRVVSDDTAGVVEVTDKIEALLPPGMPFSLEVEEGDGAVALGVDPDYVSELAGSGSLGDSETFQDAVPDAEDSLGGLYVDFDAESWLDELVGEQDPEALENVEPLSSMGASVTKDEDTGRMLLRLTTD